MGLNIYTSWRIPLSGIYIFSMLSQSAQAAFDDDIEEIIITGRNIQQIGNAIAGSSGTVGYADLKNRPITRVGEILEVIPGLVATQHSGTGKANQFFLRGFNLDHGTDFAVFADDVPINLRSHGHGQGYTDLNFIIPELVERVNFRKGPYHADAGDFSTAGTANIRTYNALEENIASLTLGEFGYTRGLIATSFDVGHGITALAAFEGHIYDSPYELDEDLEKLNGFLKLSGGNPEVEWSLTANAYDASWRSTDQVPERAIASGLIDRFGFIDPDLGGETSRYGLTAHINTPDTQFTAYAIDYDFTLFSNFTYFLNDPVRGDEFEQFDNRRIYGVKGSKHWHLGTRLPIKLTAGGDIRLDDINAVGLFGTENRVRHTLVRNDDIRSLSFSAYAKANTDLTDKLRLETGLRADTLDIRVNANIDANSGDADDTILSPSASLAWKVVPRVELYANYGEGFHSNDARGATIAFDPATTTPVDSVPLLVKARGAEVGARYETPRFKASVIGFWLNLDSELVFVGDAGTTEANEGSKRFGIETTAFWQMADWVNIHASYAHTYARFRGNLGTNDRIPNAVATVFTGGVELEPIESFSASLLLRYFGSAPLTEEGNVRSESTVSANFGGYYRLGNMQLGIELLNIFDSRDPDISYFFESRLPGEVAPVADLHTHTLEPRQVRASINYRF